ncbi:MAG: hypothetical protein Q9190_005388 [Brigantiaea leucoxantha]
MFSYQYFPVAAALCTLLADTALAQDNSTVSDNNGCANSSIAGESDQAIQHPNASASYSLPSFSPPGDTKIPSGNWTWNTAVTVSDNQIWQSWWIDTPSLKNLDNTDIPYEVCALALDDLPRSISLQGQDDNGNCLSTLNQGCVDALVRLANTTAAGLRSSSGSSSTTIDPCGNFLNQILSNTPEECQSFSVDAALGGGAIGTGKYGPSNLTFPKKKKKKLFSNQHSSIYLGLFANPDPTDSPASNNTNCEDDPTDQNTVHSLFSIERNFNLQTTTFNATEYDEATYRVTPFLSSAWLKDAPNGGGSAWADTRLICMRAKDIEQGSRTPAPAPVLPASTTGPSSTTPTPTPTGAAIRSRDMGLGGVIAAALGSLAVLLLA